jgi:hypothetical protein
MPQTGGHDRMTDNPRTCDEVGAAEAPALRARHRARRLVRALMGVPGRAPGSGVNIFDFLVGAFWVVVTLFALLWWGAIAYVVSL